MKKKAGAKADKTKPGKDAKVAGQASGKAKPKKAAPKKTQKNEVLNGPVCNEAQCEVVKQRRIRSSDAVEQDGLREPRVQGADPFEIAKQTMKGSVPAIVETMVKLAKRGSCSHAKTLLEMTGAKHMFGGEVEEQDSGEPWAKLVLERLGEIESSGEELMAGKE